MSNIVDIKYIRYQIYRMFDTCQEKNMIYSQTGEISIGIYTQMSEIWIVH